jgi:hypothetical protein
LGTAFLLHEGTTPSDGDADHDDQTTEPAEATETLGTRHGTKQEFQEFQEP